MKYYITINYDDMFKVSEIGNTLEFVNEILSKENRLETILKDVDKNLINEILGTLTEREEILLRWYFQLDNDLHSHDKNEYMKLQVQLGFNNVHEMAKCMLRGLRKLQHPSRAKKFKKYKLFPKTYTHKIDFKTLLVNEFENLIQNNYVDQDSYLKNILIRNNLIFEKIENKIEVQLETKDTDDFKRILIEDLDLSARSYACLKRAKVNTLYELIDLISRENLKNIRNLGNKSHDEIKEKVEQYIGDIDKIAKESLYRTNIIFYKNDREKIEYRYIQDNFNSKLIAEDLYRDIFEKDYELSLIKDSKNFFDTKITSILLMSGYMNVIDVIDNQEKISETLKILLPEKQNGIDPLNDFFDTLMIFLKNRILVSEEVHRYLENNDYTEIKKILNNSSISDRCEKVSDKIKELEQKCDSDFNSIKKEIELNLMDAKENEDYAYILLIDIYNNIISHVTNFDTVLKVEKYLKSNNIKLVRSLNFFKENIANLFNLYFEQKSNEDIHIAELDNDLCDRLKELFENEYFDGSYTSELASYVQKWAPNFDL